MCIDLNFKTLKKKDEGEVFKINNSNGIEIFEIVSVKALDFFLLSQVSVN